jgi:hypothetical protein
MLALATLLALAASAAATASRAQDWTERARQELVRRTGTNSVNVEEQRADGVLQSCYLTFTHLTQDHVYKQGAYIRIGGSIGMTAAPRQNIGVSLKVAVFDVIPPTMQLAPSAPISAHFLSGDKSSKPFFMGSRISDTPGGLFSVYRFDAYDALSDALAKERMIVAFNRSKDGADLQITVDLTVSDTNKDDTKVHSSDMVSKFKQCASTLIDATLPDRKSKQR